MLERLSVTNPDRRIYRTAGTLRGAALMTAAALGAIVMAVAGGKGAPVGYVFAPLLLFMSWRAWHMGAQVEPGGVRVVGFVFGKRVAWSDIDHFEASPSGRYPYVGHVVRNDGQGPVVIVGIGTSGGRTVEHHLEAQQQIEPLNDALRRWREAHGPAHHHGA